MLQKTIQPIIALDTETSGLDHNKHELIEFSGFRLGPDQKIIEELTIKVNMERPEDADPDSLMINKYHERDWSSAVSQKEAAGEIAGFLDGSVIVGHNINFDRRFIAKMMSKTRTRHQVPFRMIDTKTLCIAHLARYGLEQYSLLRCCEFLSIPMSSHHTARSDALACLEIFRTLCPINPLRSLMLHTQLMTGGRLVSRDFLNIF